MISRTAAGPVVAKPQTKPKILIVEDEGIIAAHLMSRLQGAGYDVVGVAESSDEALAKVVESSPDLILMDIRIKGSHDGVETAELIRKSCDLPLIYLTAHNDLRTIDRARNTGASGFLTKPIHNATLTNSIEMALGKHRADRELLGHQMWIGTVLRTITESVAVIDADARVRFLNPAAEALTGWTDEEAHGREIAEILPLSDAATGLAANEILLPPAEFQPPRTIPRGLLTRSRSGAVFSPEGAISPSFDQNKVLGAVVNFRDSAAGQSEIRLQEAGRLAGALAHDFNNLLMVILGYTEITRKRVADPEARRALDGIDRAREQASEITGQLLDFCRKEPIVRENVCLNELLSGMKELLKVAAGPAVQCRFDLGPDLRRVRANAGQLKQMVMNLAVNARDAMPEGGTLRLETANVETARITAAESAAASSFVELTATDTGCGMTRHTSEHLFESGFTTKTAGTAPRTGNGIGLAAVHGIVTDLGGSIALQSAPGEGASFRIRIPATMAAAVPDYDPEPAPRKTVLLLEKDEMLRDLLTMYLGDWDCSVLKAAGAEEACALARGHGAIDLFIADIGGLVSDGMALARSLTEAMPKMQTLLIADCEDSFDGRISRPSGSGILRHPFARMEFRNRVACFLPPPGALPNRDREGAATEGHLQLVGSSA